MTQLVKQRPLAVWCLFLAGAVTGGLASSLFEPHYVLAEPTDLNGQKFEDLLRLVEAHDLLLEGISRDESGGFFFSEPLTVALAADLTGPALTVTGDPGPDSPLMVVDPDMIHSGVPSLAISGTTLFSADAGPDPLVKIEDFMLHPGVPVFDVGGANADDPGTILARFGGLTEWTGSDPDLTARMAADELSMEDSLLGLKTCLNSVELLVKCGRPGAARFGVDLETGVPGLNVGHISVEGSGQELCVRPDRIELLVECGDPLAFVTLGANEVGGFLTVRDISGAGSNQAVCVHPDRIDWLMDCDQPQVGMAASLGVDTVGSYLVVEEIQADTVKAYDFVDRGGVIEPF